MLIVVARIFSLQVFVIRERAYAPELYIESPKKGWLSFTDEKNKPTIEILETVMDSEDVEPDRITPTTPLLDGYE